MIFSLSLDQEDRESKKLQWGAAVLDRLPFTNVHKKKLIGTTSPIFLLLQTFVWKVSCEKLTLTRRSVARFPDLRGFGSSKWVLKEILTRFNQVLKENLTRSFKRAPYPA